MYQLAKNSRDIYLKLFLKLNALFSFFVVGLIFFFLLKESIPSLGLHFESFLFDESWYPLEGKFSLMPMLIGSLMVAVGASILALPLGFFSAIFYQFYLNKSLRWVYLRGIELYTGIPSVVFGFWGLMKLVPWINQFHPPGQSLIAGILVLSLMIFPIISLSLISYFGSALEKEHLVSDALGIRKSRYIWSILLPSSWGHILSSCLLSLGRAIGETMAVLMVCGNIVKIPHSLFDPVRTLTANIALEMSYAMEMHRASLFVSGFLLFCVVVIVFSCSEALTRRFSWRS